jgi:hypothetical protein
MEGDLKEATKESDGLLSVTDLVEMFEASEDATYSARQKSERDRDYVDNIQLTAAEITALEKRGQPPIITNRIKRSVEFLKGYELSQRVDPKVLPNTPQHEEDANGAEQALRYVEKSQRLDYKRSKVWSNLLVEGMAGYRVSVKPYKDGYNVTVDRIPWDRMFYDPHSSEADFSDAKYIGAVRWLDFDDALAEYPDAANALEWTLDQASISDTYDDNPKHMVWADKKRKRVRVVQIWIKQQEQWFWAEYTKGGILKSGPSPYQNDKGESDCELLFASAYVNRDNERYGLVREMIGPQDEINKRRSKALHLLNTEQTISEEGVVNDVEKARRERARPDGWTVVAPGALADKRIQFETRTDLANGHMQLLQEAKNEIDMIGGNIALQGNALQKTSASGKAIIASQQGGAMEIAPLMDELRDLDIRLFRAIWARIRQFWTAEKWVRVTDDERNVKWVGLNVDPMRAQMIAQQSPQFADKIAGIVSNVAELDCDIDIDDAPDGLTPQLEQFQSLVELKKMDANGELPFRAILTAMPNLRNKAQVLAQMDKAQEKPPEVQQIEQHMMGLQMAGAEAQVQETQASAQLKQAQAFKAVQDAGAPMQGDAGPSLAELSETQARIHDTHAAAGLKEAQTAKVMQDIQLAPEKMAQEMALKRQQAASRPAAGANGR